MEDEVTQDVGNQQPDGGNDPCAHCAVGERVDGEPLCDVCIEIPRCEVCDVIMGGGISVASENNPKRCTSCVDFETRIKGQCFICGRVIPETQQPNGPEMRAIVRGNCCSRCSAKAARNARKSGTTNDADSDYLNILRHAYENGAITKEQWDLAREANQQNLN